MSRNPIRRFLRHGMLPQLAVFEAAARLGSFTRAAEELHLAQPTVSIQMRKLAEAIGLPLFEQIGRKTHLTRAGRLLYEGCRELFAELERIERALSALRGLEAGELRLAVSTTGKYFAPRLLGAFVARHPGVQVTLEIHNRRGLIERLAENRDDLYIFANPPRDHELVGQVILPNSMVAFARADHPLARERAIPFARFAEEPFLMREAGSGTRLVAEELFARHGLAPRVRMELSTNEAVKQAILAGLGVSIMSRYTLGLDTESPQLAALDVKGLPVERPWQIVYPVGKQVPPAAQAFMTLVRDEARRLVYEHLGRNGRHASPGAPKS